MTRSERLAHIRAGHRRWLMRESRAERYVRLIAPHLRGDVLPSRGTLDLLDELVRPTVAMRGEL